MSMPYFVIQWILLEYIALKAMRPVRKRFFTKRILLRLRCIQEGRYSHNSVFVGFG